MKTFSLSYLFLFISFLTTALLSQEKHMLELIVNTAETDGATVTFYLDLYDPDRSDHVVWDPNGYITTDSRIANPDEIQISDDYSGTDYGWDGDCKIFQYHQTAWMGRTEYYRLWVQGKLAFVKVECYGVNYNYPGVDFKVVFYYKQDKFKDVYGNDIYEIDLYDNQSGLQPTPPSNFRCTNAGQIGQHPNFAWELPPQPTGVTFK